ncbi:acetylcholine receptor subunit beta-type unc-29-like [Pecten maximus]|uniref:acetylcholine receptor subunit beta-type unc-29-like n=1 Tax=Pecten maximus TaxID=6579 RepID=UPI0014582B84|nr:acetylcholine receptor subunit beta-type unc-29-like [Pecten maximus]
MKEFEEKTGKFSINGISVMTWHDCQLEWNPNDFGGIDRIFVSQKTIWKPDLLLLNPFDNVEPPGFDSLKIAVDNDGSTFWGPPNVYQITCPADITYYPFDQQTCSFFFSMYMYTLFDVFIETSSSAIDLDFYYPNSLWEMISARSRVFTLADTQTLELTVVLKRRPMFQVINTIVPFCILGLLNIMVFLLPAESGERVGFSVTVLLAIAVFMTIVSDTLPGTSEPSFPRLCYLLMAELCTNMLVTICTILVLRLYHKPPQEKIPSWLKYIICKRVCVKAKTKNERKKKSNTNTILSKQNRICSETTVSTILESDRIETGSMTDSECNCNENGQMETSWQDVAKFLDVFFFVLFIAVFGTSKLAAYLIFM